MDFVLPVLFRFFYSLSLFCFGCSSAWSPEIFFPRNFSLEFPHESRLDQSLEFCTLSPVAGAKNHVRRRGGSRVGTAHEEELNMRAGGERKEAPSVYVRVCACRIHMFTMGTDAYYFSVGTIRSFGR